MGRLFGHFPEIRKLAKLTKKNIGMGLYLKRPSWYQAADSKTVEVTFIGKPKILCADPNIYKEVLGAKQDAFTNSVSIKLVFGCFFPTSVIVVDGDQWQRIRKVMQRAMTKQSLDLVVSIMFESSDLLLQHPNQNQIPTKVMITRIAFDSFHRVMYGWDPKSTIESPDSVNLVNACDTIVEAIGKRSARPMPLLWKLPTKNNKAAEKACAFIKRFIADFITSRKSEIKGSGSSSSTPSLLDAMILAAESGEDGGMTQEELSDQIATLFFAAFGTTAETLRLVLNYLARYPAEQDSLRAHVRDRFPDRAKLAAAPLAEVEAIAPLCHFIDEVNRLHGIAPFVARTALRDVEVAGRAVRSGTEFLIDSAAVGRDPALWEGQADLDSFRPSRWAEFRPSVVSAPMPFGIGARICPGRRIALAEMRALVAALVHSHRVALRRPDEAFELDMLLGLSLAGSSGDIDFAPL